jgi:hypothetical protein
MNLVGIVLDFLLAGQSANRFPLNGRRQRMGSRQGAKSALSRSTVRRGDNDRDFWEEVDG